MSKSVAIRYYTQSHKYLNEEFYNRKNELCRVVEGRKRYGDTHVTILNTVTDIKYIMLVREYECQTAFGSYLPVTEESKLIYG
jgi:hypothetical protein